MANTESTQVLIAGAGPVGLSLSIELGLRGISCIVAEKRDGVLKVPRMSSVSSRAMEFCRRWGIADTVRDAVWSRTHPRDFVYTATLDGGEIARLSVPSYAEREGKLDYSPEGASTCPQIFFDPILAEKAKSVPLIDLRYHTRLETFEQDANGVRARLTGTETGNEFTVEADYLVGCDGSGGVVRRQMGIEQEGLGQIATSVNVFFRAPDFVTLSGARWARNFRFFDEDGCWAEAIAIDGEALWRLSVFDDPNPDLTGHSYLRKLSDAKLDYEILDVSPWDRRDFLATSFRDRRAFIVGDMAHEMSPTGGSGMHSGICEAINLAWKLEAIFAGWGGPNLLDSYEAECRPVGAFYVDLSTTAYNRIAALPGATEFRTRIQNGENILSSLSPSDFLRAEIRYENSPVCVPDGTKPPEGDARMKQTARSGTRAPHCWIGDGKSIMDLFGWEFVLLRFGAPDTDVSALVEAAAVRGVPLKVEDIDDEKAAALYEKPLVLVRPDGHIAWRGDALPDNAAVLIDQVRGA